MLPTLRVGALVIGFLLIYIRRASLGIFAAYGIVLAIVIIVVYVARLSSYTAWRCHNPIRMPFHS